MRNISKKLKLALALTSTLVCVNTFAATECKLGDTCSVPNTLDKLYFSFTPSAGSKYQCELTSTKDHALQVDIINGKDFVFEPQTVKADADGQTFTATIPGHFKDDATEGQIIVHQTLFTSNAEGTIKCFPAE